MKQIENTQTSRGSRKSTTENPLLFISIFLLIGLVILIQIPNFIFIIPKNNTKK